MSETLTRDAILEVDGLTMRFGGLLAVDSVGFAARRGDITALVRGPLSGGLLLLALVVLTLPLWRAQVARLRRGLGKDAEG